MSVTNEQTKTKQPNWKKWADELFIPWYEENEPIDLELPESDTNEGWQAWGESIYKPWYELHKPVATTDSGSNPGGTPPPPPGHNP